MKLVALAAFGTLAVLLVLCVDTSSAEEECEKASNCSGGVIIPAWDPVLDISTGTKVLRAIIYFAALCYMFLGVSQIADIFMEAIETITSTTAYRTIVYEDGTKETIQIQVWNETVANLTLMALGSSAPEIMLSVIEIIGSDFVAGDLGPGTIIGSAAFNLFIITAICVCVIPDGEMKKVKNFGVFACTSAWSVLSYVWLYMMIAVITPEKVDWWEGLITLLMFGAFIIMSYTIDRNNESCAPGFRIVGIVDPDHNETQKIHPATDANDTENGNPEKIPLNDVENGIADNPKMEYTKHVTQKMSNKEKIVARLKQIAQQFPKKPDCWYDKVDRELRPLILEGKSRAYFRIHSRDVNRLVERYRIFLRETVARMQAIKKESSVRNVIFCADSKVKFAESCGKAEITIEREGPFVREATTKVHFTTVEKDSGDNAATAGKDFETAQGTLVFGPGETRKTIEVVIYDDPDFEEDEEFLLRLSNLEETKLDAATYVEPTLQRSEIVCIIVDDDHHGRFGFESGERFARVPSMSTPDSEKVTQVTVERTKGCKGRIRIPYEIELLGSCTMGKHFTIAGKPEVIFNDKQYTATIEVEVLPFEALTADNKKFQLHLKEPEVLEGHSEQDEAKPELVGDCKTCEVIFATELEDGVHEGPEKDWGKKIRDSLFMEKDPQPSMSEYIMHYLQMPFTLLFCLVPPPGIWGGWAAFCVAITLIGFITALIGDLASAFGCTVGLKDTVTAITLVALGTSLPDTFASKLAATNDKYADSSVGNITGSNAVNVFLGVGVAWFVAAVYHEVKGTPGGFVVEEGSLGLSVTVFVVEALVVIAVLVLRRIFVGCELGGPKIPKYGTAALFTLLWIVYLLISILNAYCVIESPI